MKGDFVFREAPPQPALSQDKLIEEAARAAAERAAALTAERMSREQAARQARDDTETAEQAALAAEREKLLRERERLLAENAALRRKPAQGPAAVALAAPTLAPRPAAAPPQRTGSARPEVGDTWTYRFSDNIYGKSETYSVRVTAASAGEIADEARFGKARHTATFDGDLAKIERRLGNLPVTELAPYLLSRGPLQDKPEWKQIELFTGQGKSFRASLAGTETVKVPAGSFEAFKFVIEGQQQHSYYAGTSRQYRVTVWYVPVVKRFIKLEISADETIHMNRVHEIIELLSFSFPMTAEAPPVPAGNDRPVVTVASLAPVDSAGGTGPVGSIPKVGDSWTYRYTDKIFGKSETYTVRVTSASAEEIADEARIGKTRHSAAFDGELALTDRKLGGVSLREISPYLMNLGTMKGAIEQKTLSVFNNSNPFTVSSAGTETVQVPAGQFEAHKLVLAGNEPHPLHSNVARGYTITVWYAPKAKRFVKLRFHGIPGMTMTEEEQTIEMLEYRLQ